MASSIIADMSGFRDWATSSPAPVPSSTTAHPDIQRRRREKLRIIRKNQRKLLFNKSEKRMRNNASIQIFSFLISSVCGMDSGINGMDTRMKCWNSTRCDIYRSVRNAIKLTKWQEMLRSQPLWGHFWRILCYEAGHKWTQPTLHCTCCAVCIGRHNCRHYNWLAAASVLGCLQNHKNNTSFSFCSWKQN